MATLLERRDNERQSAEEALSTANAELEARVQERTGELRAEIEERLKLEQFDSDRNRLLELVA